MSDSLVGAHGMTLPPRCRECRVPHSCAERDQVSLENFTPSAHLARAACFPERFRCPEQPRRLCKVSNKPDFARKPGQCSWHQVGILRFAADCQSLLEQGVRLLMVSL